MTSFIAEISWPDSIALVLLFSSFTLYAKITDLIFGQDISVRMMEWRRIWVKQLLWREERITDVSIVRGLISTVSFFATTTVFVISGLVALLGASNTITMKLNSLPHLEPVTEETVIVKLCALLGIAIAAFFKFGWAMRLHANALLMVGSAPEPQNRHSERAQYVVEKLAEMSALASQHFQGGVRAYYFGFASLPWLLSSWMFFPSLFVLLYVSIRRDYFSKAFQAAMPPIKIDN